MTERANQRSIFESQRASDISVQFQTGDVRGRAISTDYTSILQQVRLINNRALMIVQNSAVQQLPKEFSTEAVKLNDMLKPSVLSAMPTILRNELLRLLRMTKRCLDELNIPHSISKQIEMVAKSPERAHTSVRELNQAAQELASHGKLTIKKEGRGLTGTKRKPLAWIKQLFGKVGTSLASFNTSLSIIAKAKEAYENIESLSEKECRECFKSLLAIEKNTWFQGCLEHLPQHDKKTFEKTKQRFLERVHDLDASINASINASIENVFAIFDEKIHRQNQIILNRKSEIEKSKNDVVSKLDLLEREIDEASKSAISDAKKILLDLGKSPSNDAIVENFYQCLAKLPKAIREMVLKNISHPMSQLRSTLNILKGDVEQLEKLQKAKIEVPSYLRRNGREMMRQAEASDEGSMTASKSETSLPYTLRCFKDRESGTFSFEIHLGTFAEGGEASIKDVVNLTTGEKLVRRKLKPSPDQSSALEAEQKQVAETALLQKLAEIPGILRQEMKTYVGKQGRKKQELLSQKYERGSLADYCTSTTSVDNQEEKNKNLGTKLVQIVCQMHNHDVVHRDLKLENVLQDTEGNIVLIDFGLAVEASQSVQASGTPGYYPPELLLKETTTSSKGHDLFSLGMMLLGVMSRGTSYQNTFNERLKTIHDIQAEILLIKDNPKQKTHLQELQASLLQQLTELRSEIQKEDSPIGKPYGSIIAQLLDPNPESRMTDEQLLTQWPEAISR
jgi:serine/threonine protein kinase